MRIGYPCINLSIGCKSDKTFRLKSYSEQRLKMTIGGNIECLHKILQFNVRHNILFFRITSDLVPFASHPINRFNWQKCYGTNFEEIGDFIKRHNIRIAMHPDQFTLINSLDKTIFKRSQRELLYHSNILDLMKLDNSAKIQIHVGGAYGEKMKSMKRFVSRFFELNDAIRRRLVIENDDRLYDLQDCIRINEETQLPVLLDIFHHSLNCSGETLNEALRLSGQTWKKNRDGVPMLDYSSQKPGAPRHQHAETMDVRMFRSFLKTTLPNDFDVMLEIKDKENSAIKAVKVAFSDPRFRRRMPIS